MASLGHMRDDLGADVPLPAPATRVVSLVPSLTEALAVTAPDLLVGATDWCTHPADLDVTRVRGTKNPDLAAIRALSPDLVVANKEENRELDVRRLRDAGVAVWVTAHRDRRGVARLDVTAPRRGPREVRDPMARRRPGPVVRPAAATAAVGRRADLA